MRFVALFLSPAFFISSAAWADSQRDCAAHADSAARIAACSELIKKNPRDAAALLSRASAFQSKGEMDKALADYSKAVELKPNYAAAYERRGAAYAAKGDDRAKGEAPADAREHKSEVKDGEIKRGRMGHDRLHGAASDSDPERDR